MSFGVSNATPPNRGTTASAYKTHEKVPCLTKTMSPPHVSCSCIYLRKRAFGPPIATAYKTNAILHILTLSITIGHRHADRTWRSRAYIREEKRPRAKSVFGRICS